MRNFGSVSLCALLVRLERNTRVYVLFACLFAACGDPVTSQKYPGEPRFRLEGVITRQPGIDVSSKLKLAVSWIPNDDVGERPPMLESSQIDILDSSTLTKFQLAIYDLPTANALNVQIGNEVDVAFGYIFAYEDSNDNGILEYTFPKGAQSDEKIVGASPNTIVAYSKNDWKSDWEPTFSWSHTGPDCRTIENYYPGVRLPAGWSLIHVEPQIDEYREKFSYVNGVGTTECVKQELSEGRSVARLWTETDQIEVRIVGDISLLPGEQLYNVIVPHID